MASSKVFTIAQPALHKLVRGVFTNKKDLFETFSTNQNIEKIEFKDVMKYENKKFNYFNVLQLLKVLVVGDSFTLRLTMTDKTVKIVEVSLHNTNTQIALL